VPRPSAILIRSARGCEASLAGFLSKHYAAHIVDRTRPFAWDSWADEVGLDTPEPKQVIELDTMSAVVRAAERGLGVALVPLVLCDSWMRSGALVRVFAVQLATNDSYYLVSRPKDAEKPQVRALTRWALQEYQRG